MTGVPLTLAEAVETLADFHGAAEPPATRDPFELVLLENVAYLAPDERRREAFEKLRTTIGTRPQALLQASLEALEEVTSLGILAGTSAAKLRRCAEIAMREFGGDLRRVVSQPSAAAKRALFKFPGVGEPGAEKILLFAAGRPFLAPESNGLRVLCRLGLVREESSYARTYAAAREAAASLGTDPAALQRAHLMLRLHGRRVCRRSRPDCPSCPLRARCAYARAGHDLPTRSASRV